MKKIKIIYLDVDGVLADFKSGLDKIFPDQSPSNDEEMWNKINQLGSRFWSELEPYSWFKDLYKFCNKKCDTMLLTKPSKNPISHSGKCEWIQRHFGVGFRNYSICCKKYLHAHTNAILIDDFEKNINKFIDYGGHGILFPSYYNENKDKDINWVYREINKYEYK